ncbi:MAG: GNAT family N-acetyltransferase [Spirochaetales bacterium]|nr:GNAT family N-acetyltransferase [Spirochaetales bacterium]
MNNELKTVELFSERLILNEITWKDLENIHALHSIPQVDEYNTLGIPKHINATKLLLKSIMKDQKSRIRKHYWFSIRLKTTGEFIGLCGMNVSADRFKIGEIFYKLHPAHWMRGYATEVAKTLVQFGFEVLKLHRIEAGVATENSRSVRVLEKIGMKREGVGRKILPIRGKWKDNFLYAIIEDDKRDY